MFSISDELLEVLADRNLKVALLLGHIFALHEGIEFVGDNILDELLKQEQFTCEDR